MSEKVYYERGGVVHEVDPSEKTRIEILEEQGFTEIEKPDGYDEGTQTGRPFRIAGTGRRRGPLLRDGMSEKAAIEQARADTRTNTPEDDQVADPGQVAALQSGDLLAEQEAVQSAMAERAEGSVGTSGGAYNQAILREDVGLAEDQNKLKKDPKGRAAPGSRRVPATDPANASNEGAQ